MAVWGCVVRIRRVIFSSILMVGILLVFASVAVAEEEQPLSDWQVRTITTPVTGAAPSFISADGSLIAWTGATPSGSRTYVFDMATGINTAIPHSLPGSYYNPCIDGSFVVFQGGRLGAYDDIYLYDVGRDVITQITSNAASGDGNDWDPRVEGRRVVWERDGRVGTAQAGIYLYDMDTDKTSLILPGDDYRDPDIWGDYVVCVKNVSAGDSVGPASEIILHDLATQDTICIADTSRSNEHPRIDDGRVVWTSGQVWSSGGYNPWLTYQIQSYDIDSAATIAPLTNNVAGNLAPDLEGDLVVWETKQPSGIMCYDLAAQTQIQLPLQADSAHSPDVAAFGIAWFGDKGLYTAVPGSDASTFPDVPTSYIYYEAVESMVERDIISGYTTGYFGPDDPVTRQQFAKMIVLARGLTASLSDTYSFTDSPSIIKKPGELYAYHYVARAALSGLIRGYTDGSFRPYNNITRQQVITLVVRAGSTVLQPAPSGYNGLLDYSDPTHGGNICVAEYNGLLNGISASPEQLRKWDTTKPATRGECAQLLWNLMQKLDPAE